MLRPATPLAVLFLVAFALLLLSTLSTPIIKAIPLAEWNGTRFGVFGYCNSTGCSELGIGYSTKMLMDESPARNFSLPLDTRHSLSSILVVHPVAAFMCLVCFALSVAAHFHAPSHSPRYLLALLILIIPTVLVSLLAFLVDILVFVPHVQWGGWIVLGSTILIIASMIVTCAMRRTLVSRKARKRRIAENAEMSGESYYNQRAEVDMNMGAYAESSSYNAPSSLYTAEMPKADSPPPMPISPTGDQANYAMYDLPQKTSAEESMPLNGNGAAPGTIGRNGSNGGYRQPGMGYGSDPYNGQGMGLGGPMAAGAIAPELSHQRSDGSMRSRGSGRGRGGPPPMYGRGRGGYGPPRGGYPPRGGPYGRGMRGGPMGYGGPGRGGPMMGRGGAMRGPPPMYGHNGPPPPSTYGGSTYVGDVGSDPSGRGYDYPHMPIGQAVEMDERSGVPSPEPRQNYGLRDSDTDVRGMVGMQQHRGSEDDDRPVSPLSDEGEGHYVPARSNWDRPQYGHEPHSQSSIPTSSSSVQTPHTASSNTIGRALSPIAHSPVHDSHAHYNQSHGQAHPYYEDPDPSFAASSVPRAKAGFPSALLAGGNRSQSPAADHGASGGRDAYGYEMDGRRGYGNAV